MIFIETSVFTRQVLELLTDEEYADFQSELAANPLAGDVIEAPAGCARCASPQKEEANAAAHA